jgi:tRNA G26 N,N-dimethylase Trm1
MQVQLHEYVEFVRSFADQANIMTKSFYIVIPYSSHGPSIGMSTMNLLHHTAPVARDAQADTAFEQDRAQLEQRMALVIDALSGTGVRAVPLGTEEAIELLYRSFNPGELENPIRLDNK